MPLLICYILGADTVLPLLTGEMHYETGLQRSSLPA